MRILCPTHIHESQKRAPVELYCAALHQEELKTADVSLKNKKAPGSDNIKAEILQLIAKGLPSFLLRTYKACLKERVFQERLKIRDFVSLAKLKPTLRHNRHITHYSCKMLIVVEPAVGLSQEMHSGNYRESGSHSQGDTRETSYSRSLVLLVQLDAKNPLIGLAGPTYIFLMLEYLMGILYRDIE